MAARLLADPPRAFVNKLAEPSPITALHQTAILAVSSVYGSAAAMILETEHITARLGFRLAYPSYAR